MIFSVYLHKEYILGIGDRERNPGSPSDVLIMNTLLSVESSSQRSEAPVFEIIEPKETKSVFKEMQHIKTNLAEDLENIEKSSICDTSSSEKLLYDNSTSSAFSSNNLVNAGSVDNPGFTNTIVSIANSKDEQYKVTPTKFTPKSNSLKKRKASNSHNIVSIFCELVLNVFQKFYSKSFLEFFSIACVFSPFPFKTKIKRRAYLSYFENVSIGSPGT